MVFTSMNKFRKANEAYDHRWETSGPRHEHRHIQRASSNPLSFQFMYKSNGEPQKDPRGPGAIAEAFHTDGFCQYFSSHLWEHCCFSMSKGSENSNDLITTIIFTLTKGQTSLKTVTGRKCSVLFKRAETLQIGVIWMWPEPSELEF